MFGCILRFADNIKAVARYKLRRVTALVIALLMCGQLSARAIAPALAVAGVAAPAVISAFLAASGIYLYDKAQAGSADGTYGKVIELWDEFRSYYTQQFPSNPEPPQDFSGFVTLGGIYLSAKVFDLLSQFATWLKGKFSLDDNDDVNLGGGGGGGGTASNFFDFGTVYHIGTDTYGNDIYLERRHVSPDITTPVQMGIYTGSTKLCFASSDGSTPMVGFYLTIGDRVTEASARGNTYVAAFDLLYYGGDVSRVVLSTIEPNWPILTGYSNTAAIRDEILAGAAGGTSVGVHTGDISIPSELPEGTEAGGIYIPGVTDSTTPGEVEEIIEQSVTTGTYPNIKPIPVDVQDGVTVTDNGVEPGAIVIGSAQVPVPVTAYQVSGLETVWPFSIPWDVYNILSLLNTQPQAPRFEFELYLGVGTYDIVIDLSEWDSAARICRAGEYLLFVVGMCVFLYKKFG